MSFVIDGMGRRHAQKPRVCARSIRFGGAARAL